jgi:probable rRNA maturation factor
LCRRAAAAALAVSGLEARDRTLEVSVALIDDARLRELNRIYRGRDEATNVLAFAALEAGKQETAVAAPKSAPLALGDVVVALQTARGEATYQGKPLGDHLSHLVVHGVLHLAGFDHGNAAEAEVMEGLETRILAKLGVPDPYLARSLAAS